MDLLPTALRKLVVGTEFETVREKLALQVDEATGSLVPVTDGLSFSAEDGTLTIEVSAEDGAPEVDWESLGLVLIAIGTAA